MTETDAQTEWPTTCPHCGTPLQQATIDLENTPDVTTDVDEERAEFQPGEMVAVDFCPNPDCPSHKPSAGE